MELYDVLLFLHILGVVLLFVAITIETIAGARIRGADRAEDVATWAHFQEQTTGPLHGISTLLLAVPGLWMAAINDLWSLAWVQIGIGVLVVAAALGIGYITPRVKQIHEAAVAAGDAPVDSGLAAQVNERDLWLVHYGMIGLGTGAIFIMVTKTGMVGSIVSVLIAAVIGTAVGVIIDNRSIEAPAGTGRAEV